jgi:effector-binding domain-containing protein
MTSTGCANVGGVPYQVLTEQAGPRVLAAISTVTTPQRLGADIIGSLDQIWPLLREQGTRTGHNVVVYGPGEAGELAIDAGVEVFDEFTERGVVRRVITPDGEVATAAHYGEYSDVGGAYAAIDRWCAENGRDSAGVNWEVYGDWADDPAQRRTDVYKLLRPAAS